LPISISGSLREQAKRRRRCALPPQSKNSQLDNLALQCKVIAVQPNWAEENLQVIRTLMERAGLYRRALAPVMTFVGVVGIATGTIGRFLQVESLLGFLSIWIPAALLAGGGAFLIIRRQALTASEAFWTAPTRRVALAIGQPFVAAALFTLPILCLLASMKGGMVGHLQLAASLWLGFYGCGLHAAGQFISRGVRILGWGFVCAGAINLYVWQTLTLVHMGPLPLWLDPHGLMGATFGGFHLIAGIYLYFTEKGEPTP
jgi:hypothetical protein